jgi:hypothetical protein
MSGLAGALRLAALDARGITLINPSSASAWRSMGLLVPVMLAQGLVDLAVAPANVDMAAYLTLSALSTLVQTLGYLLAISAILDNTGRADRFPLFVSTYNWCSIISTLVYVFATLTALQASTPVANGILFGLVCWGLFYGWFSVRAALACPAAVAVGMVLLELLIALVTQGMAMQFAFSGGAQG